MRLSTLLPLSLLQLLLVSANTSENFNEQLLLRPLRDGKVASHFKFTTILSNVLPRNAQTLDEEDYSQHYRLFPLTLGQILREYAVTELHLSLNAGKWNYDTWGYPPEIAVGNGAELWAWMDEGPPGSVDKRWQGLRNALSGLFCASIGSLDSQRTTEPFASFLPHGSLPALDGADGNSRYQMRYASLASEHVCTENLTPFLKTLPCKGLSGLASLLNPHRLFDANWHGMGVHVTWEPDEGVKVELSFQAVFDPIRTQVLDYRKDWSLHSLFGRLITKSCPVASSSRILVNLPINEAYSLSPEPESIENNTALFRADNVDGYLDVSMKFAKVFEYPLEHVPQVPLSIRRTLQGTTQDHGQLSILLTNRLDSPVQIRWLETMPWFITFYLHTLSVKVDGEARTLDTALTNLTYAPPTPHERSSLLESVLTLPANSQTHLQMDLLKGFLRYTEHRPDAQRGWDLPPAVFTPVQDDDHSGTKLQRTYTPPLLVDLSTPDFSMPYNVIIFSCSLVAFLFGSVFNQLTRKFVVVKLDR